MTFDEIDNFIGDKLENANYVPTRRDYREIERNDPIRFKGYGDRSGLMYLADVDGSHYIDINILPNSTKVSFRNDDHIIIRHDVKNDKYLKDYINAFLSLIDEYYESRKVLYSRIGEFNKGNIPKDIVRNNRIDQII